MTRVYRGGNTSRSASMGYLWWNPWITKWIVFILVINHTDSGCTQCQNTVMAFSDLIHQVDILYNSATKTCAKATHPTKLSSFLRASTETWLSSSLIVADSLARLSRLSEVHGCVLVCFPCSPSSFDQILHLQMCVTLANLWWNIIDKNSLRVPSLVMFIESACLLIQESTNMQFQVLPNVFTIWV